jgi:hypothetical protein
MFCLRRTEQGNAGCQRSISPKTIPSEPMIAETSASMCPRLKKSIHALDDLAVKLQYEAQHAVRRRVLGPEVEGEVAQRSLGHNGLASAAGSTPAAGRGSNLVNLVRRL